MEVSRPMIVARRRDGVEENGRTRRVRGAEAARQPLQEPAPDPPSTMLHVRLWFIRRASPSRAFCPDPGRASVTASLSRPALPTSLRPKPIATRPSSQRPNRPNVLLPPPTKPRRPSLGVVFLLLRGKALPLRDGVRSRPGGQERHLRPSSVWNVVPAVLRFGCALRGGVHLHPPAAAAAAPPMRPPDAARSLHREPPRSGRTNERGDCCKPSVTNKRRPVRRRCGAGWAARGPAPKDRRACPPGTPTRYRTFEPLRFAPAGLPTSPPGPQRHNVRRRQQQQQRRSEAKE